MNGCLPADRVGVEEEHRGVDDPVEHAVVQTVGCLRHPRVEHEATEVEGRRGLEERAQGKEGGDRGDAGTGDVYSM